MSADDARQRFESATLAHLTAPLADGVTIRRVSGEEVIAAGDTLWRGDGRPPGRLDVLWTEEHKARTADLQAVLGEPLSHRLVFEQDGALIGTYWGQQEPYARYYMVNTVFRHDVQRRGLYRALLPRVLAAATDAGFGEVHSRHRADNNAILIPKLRAGFAIAAFEVAPRFGLLVHLRKYLVEGAAKMFANRIDGAFGAELRARGALPGV